MSKKPRSENRLPIIAVTIGDPAGIGPEITVKTLIHPEIQKICRPVLVGPPSIIEETLFDLDLKDVKILPLQSIPESDPGKDQIACWSIPDYGFAKPMVGQISASAGRVACSAIESAALLAIDRQVEAIVTAPINKESIVQAGKSGGHTEILAGLCGVRDVAMLLVADKLRISHVTTHIRLHDVPGRLNQSRILKVIELTHEFLRRLKTKEPIVGVLGLNPHAGEHGLFGTEESEFIEPAIRAAQQSGIHAIGPLPADSAVYYAKEGEYDALVAMYHDQGHIPIKLLGFHDGVNVTLGLPIIRTSVDHGTAFNIAGQNKANTASLQAAIRLASQLAG